MGVEMRHAAVMRQWPSVSDFGGGFLVRVFLLVESLPAKANEHPLPGGMVSFQSFPSPRRLPTMANELHLPRVGFISQGFPSLRLEVLTRLLPA
jgi:hypothetical protein